MMSKIYRLLTFTIFIVAVFFQAMTHDVPNAVASTKVRVGIFSLTGFYSYDTMASDKSATLSGYGYDYLQELTQYIDWEYDYKFGSWEECLGMLAQGEIDLLAYAQYTPERNDTFAYANLESGISHSVLSVPRANTSLAFDDFQAFDGMRVGMLIGNCGNQSLEEFRRLNNFSIIPHLFFEQNELADALHSGKIDAMLLTNFRKPRHERIVARFAPSPFYFLMSKNEPELLKELNDAQAKIKLANPYFDADLHQKHFRTDVESLPVFTKAELAFIKHSPPIVVSVRTAWAPLEHVNDGIAGGILVDYLQMVHEITGLNFQFVPTPTLENAIARLKRNELTLVSSADRDYPFSLPVVRTVPYMSAFAVMVTNPSQEYAPDSSIAMTHDFWRSYPDTASNPQYMTFATVRDCFEAMNKGRVKAVYANALVAESLRREFEFSRFMVTSLPGRKDELAFAMSRDTDPHLLSILNKVIISASDETLQDLTLQNSARTYELTLRQAIERNPLGSVLAISVTLLLVIAALGTIIFTRSRTNRRIYQLLYIDRLTGAWNFNYFIQYLKNLMEGPLKHPYAIVYMDIERFKDLNDAHGYAYGDFILKSIVKILKQYTFSDELYARVSNDNFVAILRYTSEESFINRIKIIHQKINNTTKYEPYRIMLTCGIYIITDADSDATVTVDRANDARKTIKGQHKSNIAFYNDELRNALVMQREIESVMESALAKGQFEPFYQPKIDLANAAIVGAEALVRWRHPQRGLITPLSFIPLFEKNGFIVELDFYIFEAVCRMLRDHIDAGRTPVPISSNFSRLHFSRPGFIDRLHEIVGRYTVPPQLLELEVTENIVNSTPEALQAQLEELRDYGFHVAMDDFGTGYSSLNLLKDMPIDILKLDKDFLQQGIVSEKERIIITGFVKMAQELKFTVVCEGVETAEQAHFLRSIGCDQAQGYLFAKPMPKSDFEERLYPHSPA